MYTLYNTIRKERIMQGDKSQNRNGIEEGLEKRARNHTNTYTRTFSSIHVHICEYNVHIQK